ncbi:MAG: hypothetical protein WBL95_25005 [Microcoleus sp.]
MYRFKTSYQIRLHRNDSIFWELVIGHWELGIGNWELVIDD